MRSALDIRAYYAWWPVRTSYGLLSNHAQAMLFLTTDAASYINGITLDVNGGRIMM